MLCIEQSPHTTNCVSDFICLVCVVIVSIIIAMVLCHVYSLVVCLTELFFVLVL